jgi:hypothetical protein
MQQLLRAAPPFFGGRLARRSGEAKTMADGDLPPQAVIDQ